MVSAAEHRVPVDRRLGSFRQHPAAAAAVVPDDAIVAASNRRDAAERTQSRAFGLPYQYPAMIAGLSNSRLRWGQGTDEQ